MYADAVATISESVFPIFYVHHAARLAGVCGTGFFVGHDRLILKIDAELFLGIFRNGETPVPRHVAVSLHIPRRPLF